MNLDRVLVALLAVLGGGLVLLLLLLYVGYVVTHGLIR